GYGGAQKLTRRDQPGRRRECNLGNLHYDLVMSALSRQRVGELLQHVVFQGHCSTGLGKRIERSQIPLVDFLQAHQGWSRQQYLCGHRLHAFGRIRSLHLSNDLSNSQQEFCRIRRDQNLQEIRSFVDVVSHYAQITFGILGNRGHSDNREHNREQQKTQNIFWVLPEISKETP